MKKLKLRSTLNHKAVDYNPYEIEVEKIVELYGNAFENMKNKPYEKNPYIAANNEMMFIDSNDIVHGVLFVDNKSGDGLLVESEGYDYARKSQFIPNVRALVESNNLTNSERKLHNQLKQISDKIAELAHCGEKNFDFEELLDKSDPDLKSLLRDSVVTMLQEREDIQMAESRFIDVDFQPDITVEVKPTQALTFYCPLHIVREYDESEYDYDEEVMDEQEEIPSRYDVDCADEINKFIQDYSEPKEEHRGLMVYYDDNPAVSEKVFSAIPSVREINGELMGVFECQITENLTDTELEELRNFLTGQCSDGFFEGMEQHEIETEEFGDIYVSFWKSGSEWSLQTEEEFEMSQAEEIQPGMSL